MKKPVRILIVEDNPHDADLAKHEIRKILTDGEFLVVETRESFIRALEIFHPDVILSDFSLPHFNGMEALKLSHHHAPSTPLIIWTGSINEDVAVDCVKAGAQNYILKDNLKRLGPAILRALEEKELLTARAQAEQKYRSIFENAMEGIFQSSPYGRYINVNPAMARLYGYESPADMIESVQSIADQIYVNSANRAEFIKLLHANNTVEHYEQRNYRKDGSIIWTSTSARAVRDENGNLLYYEGFIQDITKRKEAEEALQTSERRFRALIENGLDDISLLAADGSLLWESPSTIRNLGYAPGEFVGRNIFEMMHPEDRKWTGEAFAQLLQEPGSRQRGIFRLRRADGAWRWVEAIATNLLNDSSVNAIVINYRDITEHKQAQEALQENQTKYQNLVETSHDLIWSVDTEARFTFVNRASRQIYGYEPEELIGRSFFELMDPQHYQHTLKQYQEAIANVDEMRDVDSYVRHRDGRQIILSANSIVIRDEHGNITGVTGSSHDITIRKRVEDVLSEERNLLRTLIDNIPDRIYAMDTQGRKTLSNIADWQACGAISMEEVIGKTDFDTYPPDLAEQYWQFDRTVLDSGQPLINYEEPGLDAGGNPVSILTSKIPLRNEEGTVVGLVGIGRDITERKQAEKALLESEKRYRALFEDIPIAIWEEDCSGVKQYIDSLKQQGVTDFRTYFATHPGEVLLCADLIKVLNVNKAAVQMYEAQNKDHLINNTDNELSKGEREHIHEFFADLAEGRTGNSWEGFDETLTGRPIEISLSWSIAPGNEQDDLRIIVTTLDITERKQAEEALRQSQNRYRTLIETQTEFIVRWMPDGTRTFANEAYCRYFGLTPEQAVSHDLTPLIYEQDRQPVEERIQCLLSGESNIVTGVHRVIKPGGSIGWQEWVDQAIRDENGNLIELQSTGRDITERRQAEIERQALLEIMQGLANTKDLHELLKLAHQSIGKVIYAENFFVVLYQENSGLFEEIYSIDQYDQPAPPSKLENSITSYVFRSGKPLLLTQASFAELEDQGEVTLVGTDSPSWLGVPLKTSGRTIGVIAVQDYQNENRYTEHDKDLLASIAAQVALAIERKLAEEALRESEEHYRTIFEGVQDAIFVESLDGRILMVNERACEMFGYSHAEFITKTVSDLVPSESSILSAEEAAGPLSTEPRESYNRRANGEVFPIEISGRVQIINGEKVLLVVVRDITERKKAESALIESNTQFRTLFEASPDAIVLIDPNQNWSIMDCNTAACQMNGYSREELIGKSIDILNLTSDVAERREEYLESIRNAGVLRYETGHRRKDGTVFTVDVSTSIIRIGDRDIVLGIDRDVTERKRAENDLRFEKERFEGIVATVPGVICSLRVHPDRSTSIPFASSAFMDIFGLPPQAVQYSAAPIFTRIHPDDLPQVNTSIEETVRTSQTWHNEYRYQHPTKGEIWIEGQAVPLRGGDDRIWTGFFQDVTERKRAEAAEREQRILAQALLDTAKTLNSTLDYGEVLDYILTTVGQVVPHDAASILLIEGESANVVRSQGYDKHGFSSELIQGIKLSLEDTTNLRHILETKQPLVVYNTHSYPGWKRMPSTDWLRSSVGAPITIYGEVTGFICLDSQVSDFFTPVHAKRLEAFANQAALAIHNARLLQQAQEEITERKIAEAELRASEERFRQLAENIQEAFWMTDADSGREIYMSPAVETIWGRSIQSLMYEPNAFMNSVYSEDRPVVLEAIEKEKSGRKVQLEYRIVRPDGTLRWIWDRAFPVFDDSGKVNRIAGISADITERRQAEQELRKLSRAVEQSGSAIVITDTAGKIEYVNPKFTQITGYTMEEVLGRNPQVLKSGNTPDEEYKQLWATISSGKEWHGELLNKKKDGTIYWESVTISPILNRRKEITHYVGVQEDITERKQSEIETRRHLAELEAVYENGLSVGRLLEPGEIGDRVIETFARYLPWHHVTIRLRKEGSDDLELVSFNLPNLKEGERANAEQHFIARINKVGQGLSGWVIQTGKPLRTGNVHEHPQYIDTHAGIQSGLYMPLKVGERAIGVISVESEAPDAFTEQDERLLATLANQTAIAFENARLYDAMQRELLERKRIEDALRVNEFHYRALADSITDILFELDQDLRYTHWNKASESLTGIPAWEAIGKSLEELVGISEDQARIKSIYENVLQSQHPMTFETTLLVHGEKRFFETTAYPSLRGVSVVAKDVTDRKRTETIMQKRFELMEYSAKHSLNELMLRTVDEVSELTGSTIGFFHFMEEDQIHLGMQTWSTNALQLFHVSPADGTHLPVDRAGVWAEAILARRPLIHNHYESLANKKGVPQGHIPIVREIVIPIIRNERIMAVMGIANKPQDYTSHDLEIAARLADYAWDITERKQMEIALELERNQLVERVEERTADLSRANSNLARALRVKDEFLANMSHELRTPLNAILGLSESLGEQIAGPLNEKQQKYIATISESGHHLLSLINDILDLAKIEAGQITLDINKVDIHSVCQASLRMIKQLAQKKNQEVSLEIDPGLGLMWADERRLKQMIVNLLGNAVKFTPEHGKLGLEVHGDEEANQISITVWDHGIGIKQDDLARLFQPFVQLDSGLAREATGTGLGLALVAQMARLHGGSVNAISDAGKGSHFTIVLPWEPALAVDPASRMRITGKFRAIQFDEKNKPTILLVEDTKEVVMMLKDYLELAGYKVFTAQDGLDGIVQARHVKPDLILMDVQMPSMDGFDTTRKLRSDPAFKHTPIIGLTALAMPQDRERCLEAGMDEYMSKPVNLRALVKMIQTFTLAPETRTR